MHRIMNLRPSPASAIAFVALVVAGSGIAYAAIPAGDGTIRGCYQTGHKHHPRGDLRVIDSAATCAMGETALTWNQRGPKGETGTQGATGATGPQGSKGDTGATGPEGRPGAQGEPGVKGDAGGRGEQGEPGPPGPQGPAGARGETGAAGPAGTGALPTVRYASTRTFTRVTEFTWLLDLELPAGTHLLQGVVTANATEDDAAFCILRSPSDDETHVLPESGASRVLFHFQTNPGSIDGSGVGRFHQVIRTERPVTMQVGCEPYNASGPLAVFGVSLTAVPLAGAELAGDPHDNSPPVGTPL